nr:MAG TPA: hypothetical protein [Caudoviricetes sp.]
MSYKEKELKRLLDKCEVVQISTYSSKEPDGGGSVYLLQGIPDDSRLIRVIQEAISNG